MKREKNFKTARLIEALEYIDVRFIEEAAEKIKPRPTGQAFYGKPSRSKAMRQFLALAACVLLLSAAIPAITYLANHLPDIVAFFTGDETTGTDPELTHPETPPTETSRAPETTTEPETTAPLYDGTTAEPEPEHNGSYGLEYKMNEDGKSAMLFHRGICTDENVIVASVWNGVPVTRISEAALAEYVKYKTVTIPESVTVIDMRAFKNCTGLESVVLHDGISYIGADAFENCVALTEITLPKSLEWIQTGLFMNCINLQKVIIGNEVERIVFGAFYDCSALRELHYLGTKAEWNKIQKDLDWNAKSAITVVHCTDGDVEITPYNADEPEYDGSRGLEYRIEGDHAVLVGIGTCTDKEIIVASTYNGLPVTAIGRKAIYSLDGITRVVISDTVTHLDYMAIAWCSDLESIHIPANLTTMEEYAIIAFGNIRSITVDPNNPNYYSVNNCLINREAKALILGCDTSIIPTDGSISAIAPKAFMMCDGIESITIPEGVTKIGEDAFYDCSALKSIELPESLITIDSSAFANCSSLQNVKLGGKVEYMGDYVFSECVKLGEIILPDSLSFLGDYAFQGCTALKHAVLSSNLETLALMIFASCTNLESVIIPEGVKTISTDAFSNTALKELKLPASIKAIRHGAFGYCDNLMNVSYAGTVTQWIAVEKDIGWHTVGTFKKIRCSDGEMKLYSDSKDEGSLGLEYEINTDGKSARLIGEGICTDAKIVVAAKFHGLPVTEIYSVALSNCDFIEEIVIPEGVTVIRNQAFYRCVNLKKITLPSTLEYIYDSAFADCESLVSIVIPREVKLIETWAFRDCKNLTKFTFAGTVAEWNAVQKGLGNNWNDGCPFTVIHCSDGDLELYEYDGSQGLEYRIDGDHAVLVGIGTCTDKDIAVATKYNAFPVTEIGAYALYDCKFIESIAIPEGVTVIGNEAFYLCKNLKNVTLPSTLEYIQDWAFANCESLESILIPDSIKWIGQRAFSDCAKLSTLTLGEGLEQIQENAFMNCASLKSVRFPRGLKLLAAASFDGCTKLANVSYGGSTNEWSHIGKEGAEWNSEWYRGIPATKVSCSDGDVSLSELTEADAIEAARKFWALPSNAVLFAKERSPAHPDCYKIAYCEPSPIDFAVKREVFVDQSTGECKEVVYDYPNVPDVFLDVIFNREKFLYVEQTPSASGEYTYTTSEALFMDLSIHGDNVLGLQTLWYYVIDIDGDSTPELVFPGMARSNYGILLRAYEGKIYGYACILDGLHTDATYLWYEQAGNYRGRSQIYFDGMIYRSRTLTECDRNDPSNVIYYVEGKVTTKERYEESESAFSNDELEAFKLDYYPVYVNPFPGG